MKKQNEVNLKASFQLHLKQQKAHLDALEENAGSLWIKEVTLFSQADKETRQYDLVFRNEIGDRLSYRTVYDCFKRIVKGLGFGETRIHDLRHPYVKLTTKKLLQKQKTQATVCNNFGFLLLCPKLAP